MLELTKVVNAMKMHAGVYWGLDKEESDLFEITKIDVAVDMKGSFMPKKEATPTMTSRNYLLVRSLKSSALRR